MSFEGATSSGVPSGTELARPFLPSRDFELSKKFYEAVGFKTAYTDDDLAYLLCGNTSFLLTDPSGVHWTIAQNT